jgi:hypothetical protein
VWRKIGLFEPKRERTKLLQFFSEAFALFAHEENVKSECPNA